MMSTTPTPALTPGRGGRRPGAGRKPGLRSPRSKKARQVAFTPDLWARLDAMRERLGWTQTAMFEDMAETWLRVGPGEGPTPAADNQDSPGNTD